MTSEPVEPPPINRVAGDRPSSPGSDGIRLRVKVLAASAAVVAVVMALAVVDLSGAKPVGPTAPPSNSAASPGTTSPSTTPPTTAVETPTTAMAAAPPDPAVVRSTASSPPRPSGRPGGRLQPDGLDLGVDERRKHLGRLRLDRSRPTVRRHRGRPQPGRRLPITGCQASAPVSTPPSLPSTTPGPRRGSDRWCCRLTSPSSRLRSSCS